MILWICAEVSSGVWSPHILEAFGIDQILDSFKDLNFNKSVNRISLYKKKTFETD